MLVLAARAETPAAPPEPALPPVTLDDAEHGSLSAPRAAPQVMDRPTYTLKDCVNLSLRQNPDLLIAKKNIEAAEGGVIEARAAFLPQLGVNGLAQRVERGFGTVIPSDPTLRDEDYYLTVQVTQSIFSGGANTSRMRIARLSKSTQMLNYQAAIDTVLLDVRLAYYALLLAESNIEVRRQAVDLLDEQLRIEKDRENAGLTSHSSVLRAQVSKANELPALLDATNQLRDGYLRLSRLLNIPYDPKSDEAPFVVTGSLGYDPHSYDLADALAKADASRPELKAKENGIEIEEKQLIVDRSALLPRINLFAGYDVTSDPAREDPHSYTDGYVAGISGTWQIFDGLATFGKMKATRARMGGALATRDQTKQQIEADVRQAFNLLDQAQATVESQTKNVVVARESYVLANAGYNAGLVTQLDVLQSRVDLTTAQTTEFQARYDYLAATAQLQRAVSGNFHIVNDVLPPTAPAVEPLPQSTAKPAGAADQNQAPGQGQEQAPQTPPAPSFPPPDEASPVAPPQPAGPDIAPMGPRPSSAPLPQPPLPVPSPIAPPGAAPYPSALPQR